MFIGLQCLFQKPKIEDAVFIRRQSFPKYGVYGDRLEEGGLLKREYGVLIDAVCRDIPPCSVLKVRALVL